VGGLLVILFGLFQRPGRREQAPANTALEAPRSGSPSQAPVSTRPRIEIASWPSRSYDNVSTATSSSRRTVSRIRVTWITYVDLLYGERLSTLTKDESQRAFKSYMDDALKRLDHDEKFPNEPKQIRPGENVRRNRLPQRLGGNSICSEIRTLWCCAVNRVRTDSPPSLTPSLTLLCESKRAIPGTRWNASLPVQGAVHGQEDRGRASLSPASQVGRVPRTSSGSPGRTRPTGSQSLKSQPAALVFPTEG